jgi:hypothetical protein
LQQHPNDFDGFSYFITRPEDIQHLDTRARILLEPGQIAFFKAYPQSLDLLIEKAHQIKQVPHFARWLESLKKVPLQMEIHTTSDVYDLSAVWLRFQVQSRDEEAGQHWWKPAINLLGLQDSRAKVPELLTKIFNVTGEINHNGYMMAGRLRHPDRMGDEYTFYEAQTGDKAFYRFPDMAVFWEFHGGFYATEEERRQMGLYHFQEGISHFLDLYFECLLDKKEFWIERDGSIAS